MPMFTVVASRTKPTVPIAHAIGAMARTAVRSFRSSRNRLVRGVVTHVDEDCADSPPPARAYRDQGRDEGTTF